MELMADSALAGYGVRARVGQRPPTGRRQLRQGRYNTAVGAPDEAVGVGISSTLKERAGVKSNG